MSARVRGAHSLGGHGLVLVIAESFGVVDERRDGEDQALSAVDMEEFVGVRVRHGGELVVDVGLVNQERSADIVGDDQGGVGDVEEDGVGHGLG